MRCGMNGAVWAVVLSTMALACGGGSKGPDAPKASTTDAGAADSAAGGADAGAEAPPVEHPMASTAVEATTMIDKAVDSKKKELSACADAARKRKGDPHASFAVTIAIDQEGRLFGAVPIKGGDAQFNECATKALSDAPFPRSHAGVIEVKRTFDYAVTYSNP